MRGRRVDDVRQGTIGAGANQNHARYAAPCLAAITMMPAGQPWRRSFMRKRSGDILRAYRPYFLAGWLVLMAGPVVALDEPVVWRDRDTGCAYLLTPGGGIAPRYLRDGTPDCPDARAGSRLVDETARGISRALEALQREMERLRNRFNNSPDETPL